MDNLFTRVKHYVQECVENRVKTIHAERSWKGNTVSFVISVFFFFFFFHQRLVSRKKLYKFTWYTYTQRFFLTTYFVLSSDRSRSPELPSFFPSTNIRPCFEVVVRALRPWTLATRAVLNTKKWLITCRSVWGNFDSEKRCELLFHVGNKSFKAYDKRQRYSYDLIVNWARLK